MRLIYLFESESSNQFCICFSLLNVHCFSGGIKPFAHLLHEFMLEVRFRWENGVALPGLPTGSPDHAYSLFHQKLQVSAVLSIYFFYLLIKCLHLFNCKIIQCIGAHKGPSRKIFNKLVNKNAQNFKYTVIVVPIIL